MSLSFIFLHETNQTQFDAVIRMMADRDITSRLGTGDAWDDRKLIELREWSKRDSNIKWSQREYFYWVAINHGGVVCGLAGLHPVIPAAMPIAKKCRKLRYRRALQCLIVVAPNFRGQRLGHKMINYLMMQSHLTRSDIFVLTRADNTRAVASLRSNDNLRECGIFLLRDEQIIVFV